MLHEGKAIYPHKWSKVRTGSGSARFGISTVNVEVSLGFSRIPDNLKI